MDFFGRLGAEKVNFSHWKRILEWFWKIDISTIFDPIFTTPTPTLPTPPYPLPPDFGEKFDYLASVAGLGISESQESTPLAPEMILEG